VHHARGRGCRSAHGLVDHGLDGALGHAGVVLELHRADGLPSLRSRTVPTKLATAPTPVAGAQRRHLGAEVEVGGLDPRDPAAWCP
jgi:hypothetical protein